MVKWIVLAEDEKGNLIKDVIQTDDDVQIMDALANYYDTKFRKRSEVISIVQTGRKLKEVV